MMDRRSFVKSAGLASGMLAMAGKPTHASAPQPRGKSPGGSIKHSVCKWCYRDLTVSQLAEGAAKLGMQSVELLDPDDWPDVKARGLTCAMANGPMSIDVGFNHLENHARLIRTT